MRELLLCPPDHYGIEYEINPWMSRARGAEAAAGAKAVETIACDAFESRLRDSFDSAAARDFPTWFSPPTPD